MINTKIRVLKKDDLSPVKKIKIIVATVNIKLKINKFYFLKWVLIHCNGNNLDKLH